MSHRVALVLGGVVLALAMAACGGEDPPATPVPAAPAPDAPAADASVEATVSRIMAEVLEIPPGRVRLDSRIVDDLGGDDLDLVEVVMECEAAFGVSLPDDQAFRVRTVRDLVEQIEALGGRSGR